jgi:GMP synthase (glutamine-hydrolysing)
MSGERPSLPMLVIENDRSDPVERLGGWLMEAGATLDVRFASSGQSLPATLAGFSALVVLGGAAGAYDDVRAPWLPAVRRLLTEAVGTDVPTLGVCLGAQLLAVATGGRVERAPLPEYGAQLVAKRQAAALDPLLRGLPITPDVLQWHVDEITRLPSGAELLASSPNCEVQAFRVGRLGWGLQFHIETSPDTVELWAIEDEALLADYDVPAILGRAREAHGHIAEVWRPIAARFVEIAADPGSVPQRRGLPMAGALTSAAPITDPAAIRAALAAEMLAARETHRT